VTGEENIRHMHRLRALCGAVVVGPGTVVADDPQLTTRLVAGPNPLRVVLDPGRRLAEHHRVFQDGVAETLYVCARSSTLPDEHRVGRALLVRIDGNADGVDDLREAVRMGLELGLGEETALAYGNLAYQLWLRESPADPILVFHDAGKLAVHVARPEPSPRA
jgi:hypothetical protein